MNRDLLHVEVIAENLDAAVESALGQCDCSRAEADIEILQMHSRGVLGLWGKRPARVRVKVHDRGVIARQITSQLLKLSGFEVEISLTQSRERICLLLSSEEPSLVIGRRGQNLNAILSLVCTITDRLTTDRTPINLDIDGYRERRQSFLVKLSRRMTRKVLESGKPATSPPLNLNERRVLHEIFKQESGLASHSINHEGDRKVVILQPQG